MEPYVLLISVLLYKTKLFSHLHLGVYNVINDWMLIFC